MKHPKPETDRKTFVLWICSREGWEVPFYGSATECLRQRDAFLSAECMDGSDKMKKYIVDFGEVQK